MSTRDDRMSELAEYLTVSPQGVTIAEIAEHLGCTIDLAGDTVRDLRRFLGATDEWNVTATPNGHREMWLYRLVTDSIDHMEWIGNRVKDGEARWVTLHAVASSIVRATNGRTKEGRRARAIQKHVGRLLEDLREIDLTT